MSTAGERVREAFEAALTPPLPGFVTRVELRTTHESGVARLEAVAEAAQAMFSVGEFGVTPRTKRLYAALRALDEEQA